MKWKIITVSAAAVMLSCTAYSRQNVITEKKDDRAFTADQADADAVIGTTVQSGKGDDSNMSWQGNTHSDGAAIPYIYNGLIWLWADAE